MKIVAHIASDEVNGYSDYCTRALRELSSDPRNLSVTCRTGLPKHAGVDASVVHATLLDEILKQTSDGNIHVICDADTAVVREGWDDVVRQQLASFDCFGAPYEDIGGHSSGSGTVQTYKKLPTFVFIALRPGPPWHELDVSPRKHETLLIENQDMSKVHNLPVGYRMFCDGAWRFPSFVDSRGLTCSTMVQLKADSPGCRVIKNLRDRSALNCHEEYHFRGQPFVVHQRSSRKHPFRGQEFSSDFYDAIEAYVPSFKSA